MLGERKKIVYSDRKDKTNRCMFVNINGAGLLGGAGSNWEQFRAAQVPSQLARRSVQLGAGPNWE